MKKRERERETGRIYFFTKKVEKEKKNSRKFFETLNFLCGISKTEVLRFPSVDRELPSSPLLFFYLFYHKKKSFFSPRLTLTIIFRLFFKI